MQQLCWWFLAGRGTAGDGDVPEEQNWVFPPLEGCAQGSTEHRLTGDSFWMRSWAT